MTGLSRRRSEDSGDGVPPRPAPPGGSGGVVPPRPTLRDRLIDAGYGLGWSAVCRLPEPWARQGFRLAANIAWRREGPRVTVLEGNLRRVIGPDAPGAELRDLSRQAMQSYLRYYLEAFRLQVLPPDRLLRSTYDIGHLDQGMDYLASGRGVIYALPHMANYDLAGAWIIARGAGSFTTVAEVLKPDSVYRRYVAFREGLGMEVLPASGGNSRFGILAQRLRAGKLVCLVCDRDVTGGGIEVDFFGEKARMMGGAAALAVQTGAALMPVILWYDGDRLAVQVYPEVPVPAEGDRRQQTRAMMQQVARLFEAGIREHPQDWHMLQRVFTADLDPARLAAAAGSPGPAGGGLDAAAGNGDGS